MPYQVMDLGTMTPTSSGATVTGGIGSLDDATAITIWLTSSAGGTSSAAAIQVSQFDPWLAASATPPGVNQSTVYIAYQLPNTTGTLPAFPTTAGLAVTLSPITFRGFRLATISSYTSGEVVARVTKQITV